MTFRPVAPIAAALVALAARPALAQASSATSASESEAQAYVVSTEQDDLFAIVEGRMAARSGPTAALRAYGARSANAHVESTRKVQAAAKASGVVTPPPTLSAEQRQLVGQLKAATPATFSEVFLEQHRDLNQEVIALQRGYAAGGGDPNLRGVARRLADDAAGRVSELQALEP